MLSLIILQLIDKGIYFPHFYTAEDSLDTLSGFLTTDAYLCDSINKYKDFLKNKIEIETQGNRSYFEIKSNLVAVKEQRAGTPPFITSSDGMVKILEDWHATWKQQSPFIKITMDEYQNITFTTLNEYRST